MQSWESTCPNCGALEELSFERYVNCVCQKCRARATDTAGRPITGYNTSIGGGFVAYYRSADGSDGELCREVTESHICLIDGVRYWIDEAKFGGVVVMPMTWATEHGVVSERNDDRTGRPADEDSVNPIVRGSMFPCCQVPPGRRTAVMVDV
jgi:hypothetical protein